MNLASPRLDKGAAVCITALTPFKCSEISLVATSSTLTTLNLSPYDAKACLASSTFAPRAVLKGSTVLRPVKNRWSNKITLALDIPFPKAGERRVHQDNQTLPWPKMNELSGQKVKSRHKHKLTGISSDDMIVEWRNGSMDAWIADGFYTDLWAYQPNATQYRLIRNATAARKTPRPMADISLHT